MSDPRNYMEDNEIALRNESFKRGVEHGKLLALTAIVRTWLTHDAIEVNGEVVRALSKILDVVEGQDS